MKIGFNYGTYVFVIPGIVREHLSDASADDLRVLLSVCADPGMPVRKRAKVLGIGEADVTAAISFWRGAGVIFTDRDAKPADDDGVKSVDVSAASDKSGEAENASAPGKPVQKRRLPKDGGVPKYTTAELTAALSVTDKKALVEYCQQSIGRIFNTAEAEKVVGICDYLNVSTEYVAILCDSLVDEKGDRMSLHILEKTAIELYDRGITSADSLIACFEVRKNAKTIEGKVRSLYGFGARSFTAAEKRMMEKWAEARFEDGMIEYAYELTVNATGDAPIKYTDAIIDRWIADEVKTLDAAKSREDEYQKTKVPRPRKNAKSAQPSQSSFSTDDFFEAALMRSYNSDTEDAK